MLSSIEKQLSESQRDGLIAGYKKFVGPRLPNVGNTRLTTEDLYEYLLLDPKVGDEVMTSRVASAIASVQEYTTRIVNGSEQGLKPVDPETADDWRDNDNQYAVWAAGAEINNYPENYILPSTRAEVSHYFKDLQTILNQNQLNPDRVLDAALTYLNEFEAVSNLYVLSGYIDIPDPQNSPGDDVCHCNYYFIGRTVTMPYRYYWRQLDLSKNRIQFKTNPITPNCWSDWLPISLPLAAATALEHTVRPVFYNQRLYVAWVERNPTSEKSDTGESLGKYGYTLKFGYKRFDDSWTAPNGATLMTHLDTDEKPDEHANQSELTITETDTFDIADVNLIAVRDASDNQGQDLNQFGRLMLGVFIRSFNNNRNEPVTYGYQYCDSAFNSVPLNGSTRGELFGIFSDQKNSINPTNTLQYPLYGQTLGLSNASAYTTTGSLPSTGLGSGALNGGSTNYSRIADLKITDSGPTSKVYLDGSNALHVEMVLGADFMNDFDFGQAETAYKAGAMFGATGYGFCRPNGDWGATVRYLDSNLYVFVNTAITYDESRFGTVQNVVPAGTYHAAIDFLVPNVMVAINSSHEISSGGGAFCKYLDFDKVPLALASDGNMGSFIKTLSIPWFFWRTGPLFIGALASIQNGTKIEDVCQFTSGIRIVTDCRDITISGKPTYQLQQGNNPYVLTQILPALTQADVEKTGYISVCLAVSGQHYDYSTGKKGKAENAWKWFKVTLGQNDPKAPASPPQIKKNYDSSCGLVQYLDFCGVPADVPAKTRLNTTFVRTLIQKANLGIEALLDYSLQTALLEGPLEPGGPRTAMDFNGANGLYFWEVFFHLPFFVASRFAAEQQYSDAQDWLHYIFDPAMGKASSGQPPYWNVRPLAQREGDVSKMLDAPLDPYTQGYADPEVFQKAVFIAYVTNLIAQGDMWYRQLTRDGLTQARVCYNLAGELLGPRPDVTLSSNWTPKTLDTLAASQNVDLRAFEQAIGIAESGIVALPGKHIGYLQLADNDNFIAPLNSLLLSHWDTLDTRLYNLRHSLTVDGKPMSLALFEPPENPLTLLQQRAQSGTLIGGASGLQLVIPPYRFKAILPTVYNAVSTLSSFGENLLSLFERGESAGREELQQQQLLAMSSYSIKLQLHSIDAVDGDGDALVSSQMIAKTRHDAYQGFYNDNISSTEQLVMDTHASAGSSMTNAQGLMAATGALKMIPNIFGMSDGGVRFEGATEAISNALLTVGAVKGTTADRLATTEGYRRRRDDWGVQSQQAHAEFNSIGKQLDAHAVRKSAATAELVRLTKQQQQVRAVHEVLKTRFTQAALYQWLTGQLMAHYYQVYDAVVSLSLSAQACWQYEMGDFDTTFIQTDAWNDQYRGLQVGATLRLNLQQMEAAYLARHERRLEITRTVSLMDVLGQAVFAKVKPTGQFAFDLTERLFDEDYPGHYMRQIKSVAISLPTLLGPYQDVKATLTQTSSTTLLNASIDGVKHLLDSKNGAGNANLVTNLRASQQVALSSGLNDAGLFEVRFDDERYLPFENTGAVSGWMLAFPRPTSAAQLALLNALTDVIVHVRYTALDGGAAFAGLVESALGD